MAAPERTSVASIVCSSVRPHPTAQAARCTGPCLGTTEMGKGVLIGVAADDIAVTVTRVVDAVRGVGREVTTAPADGRFERHRKTPLGRPFDILPDSSFVRPSLVRDPILALATFQQPRSAKPLYDLSLAIRDSLRILELEFTQRHGKSCAKG